MQPVREFFVDGRRLVNRCTKPDKREFVRLVKVVAAGVMVMGGIGVIVKLLFAHLFRRNY